MEVISTSEELTNTVANLDENEALRLTGEKLDNDEDPQAILEEGRIGMEIIGKKFAGADSYGKDAMAAVSLAKHWMESE